MKLLLAFALCFGVVSVDAAMRDSEGRNAAGNRREDGNANMNRFGVPVGRGDDRNDRNNGNDNNECSLNTVYINTQAVVVLVPAAGNVTGTINLYQTDGQGPVTVNGTVYGLGSNGQYGIHIHEYGNLGHGCNSAGEQFNPDGYSHGDLSDRVRYAGDLGMEQ
ncbi:SOD_CuZN2 [Ramazzottius varieornatus]|uniref:SOD_CuZN2 n=1 Tax=Ramazzottius varieornatus TaxID=947166 RepID=A0A1D1UHJ9_RAMVA|nr:SOD_CuZN2 [Ramazzottius varieornatus]